ncbi:hypothetical protein R6Q59_027370 [Mikania micrantha]
MKLVLASYSRSFVPTILHAGQMGRGLYLLTQATFLLVQTNCYQFIVPVGLVALGCFDAHHPLLLVTTMISDNKINDSSNVESHVPVVSKILNGVSLADVKNTLDDIYVVLPCVKDVVEFKPPFSKIKESLGIGIVITTFAPIRSGFDFSSRFFYPKVGIDDDPVCGGVHCVLAAY